MKIKETLAATVAALAMLATSVAPAHAEGTVIASADCSTFQINVSGLADGTQVYVGIGSQPPFGFVVGGPIMWQFIAQPGGGYTILPIGLYESTHSFYATVRASQPDGTELTLYHHYVDCTPEQSGIGNPDPEVLVAETPVQVEPDQAWHELNLDPWVEVSLAPPW